MSEPLNKLLKIAVQAGVVESVAFHIDRGDDLNGRDQNGYTPLMLAASKNRVTICEMLISAGADISLQDSAGRDVIALAREFECFDVLKLIESLNLDKPTNLLENCDASLWEAEEELVLPPIDEGLVFKSSKLQLAISSHKPVDHASDWGDVSVRLPVKAVPISPFNEFSANEELQGLLYTGYKESRISCKQFQDVAEILRLSFGVDSILLLERLLVDLDILVEDFLPTNSGKYCRVKFDAAAVDYINDALEYLKSLLFPENDPYTIYLRECYAGSLLLPPEEKRLGQVMQVSLSNAIDALIDWPEGLLRLDTIISQKKLQLFESEAHELTLYFSKSMELDEEFKDIHALEYSSGFVNKKELKVELLRLPVELFVGLRSAKEIVVSENYEKFISSITEYVNARAKLVSSNLRLVNHSVKRFLNSGLLLEDLIQEGNLGLIKAAEKYSWERGFKFSTYAVWWIRQSVYRAIANSSRVVRLPVHLNGPLVKLKKEITYLERFTSLPPSVRYLSARFGTSEGKMSKLLQLSQDAVEWDECHFDELSELGELGPEELTLIADQERRISNVLSGMDKRLADVLRLRFGFGGGDPLTLEEIGKIFDLTRERVRQLESKALDQMRGASRSKILLDLIDGCASQ
nr:sigma-70 family RNA polymerase sigma factor [uncultured Pseudomonas sp.]